jgi:hypothetical protein
MPQPPARTAPPGAFFDSDFSTIDSLLAVSLLYGLQTKDDCRVNIISVSRPNLAVAGFVDAVQRFYHGPAGNFSQLPAIGMNTSGAPGETPPALIDGSLVYKNQVKSVIDTGDPCTLFRNYLEAQTDRNAFVILAGPATNLAAALVFPGLKELITVKVKYLVVADVRLGADIPAAKKLFAEWPTPIVMSGVEVGSALPYPGASIDKEFAEAAQGNPVADAYRKWQPMPYDAPSWAMAAALYAARPKEGYFQISGPGTIAVDNQGRTSFTTSSNGNHQRLTVDPAQKEKVTLAYVALASAKPEVRRFRGPQVKDATPPPKK